MKNTSRALPSIAIEIEHSSNPNQPENEIRLGRVVNGEELAVNIYVFLSLRFLARC